MTRTTGLGLMVSLICFASTSQVHAATGAQYGTPPTGCSGDPPNNTAYLWTGTNYTGTCYAINVDNYSEVWASWDASTGFPNDIIKSVKLGGNAYLRLFWHGFNTQDNGAPLQIPSAACPYGYCSSLGSWNNQVSAVRIQTFSSCFSGSEKVSLFTDANWGGDCTMLPATGVYDTPVSMGFRNNTATGAINLSYSSYACLCDNTGLGYPQTQIAPRASNSNLGGIGWNDRTSSALISPQCWR